MENPFSKFEKFGSICDFETRKIIAQTIFNKLLKGLEPEHDVDKFFLSNEEMDNFSTTVDLILANPKLREMTTNEPELAEEMTLEILNFIHRTKRLILSFGNPYEEEVKMVDSFAATEKPDFKSYWKLIKEFLCKNYDKTKINPSFYTREFNKSLKAKPEDENFDDSKSYESVRDHLTDNWKGEILIKLEEFQQEKMEEALKEFTERMDERMEHIQQMRDMIHDMKTNFNEIFDTPKEGMSKENFEILKKYNEMLKMNHAVRELVDMLGRMREANGDEEQTATGATSSKFEWLANHASKTDLIGIKESDDLNNMLPSETALLSDPTLQTLFLKRFAEKKLQTFEFEDRVKDFEVPGSAVNSLEYLEVSSSESDNLINSSKSILRLVEAGKAPSVCQIFSSAIR